MMQIALIYPPSPFNISLPPLVKLLSQWYSKAIKKKIKERKEKFKIGDIKVSPATGYRILPTIAYLSSQFKANGVKVKLFHLDYLLDNGYSLDRICRQIAKNDCALFITSTIQYNYALQLLNKIKSISDIPAIISGREATFLTFKTLKDGFDIAIRGEVEAALPSIFKLLKHSGEKGLKLKGIGIRFSEGRIRVGRGVNKLRDFNKLPLPDFSIFPKELRKNANISWWVSRGCPFRCEYCYEPFFWNPLRFKSIEKLRLELELYKKFFPFDHIFFHDSTFNVGYWKDVIKMVKNEFGLEYSSNFRLDILGEKDIEFLKKYNPFAIFSGIDSASKSVLRKLNRHQNLFTVLKRAKEVNKITPFLTLSFIIGLPFETLASLLKIKKLIKSLLTKDKIFQVTVRLFTPYPGTPIFHNPKKYGIKILSLNFKRYDRYSFPPVIRTDKLDELTLYWIFLDIYSMIVKLNLELTGFDIKEFEEKLHEKLNFSATNIYKVNYEVTNKSNNF